MQGGQSSYFMKEERGNIFIYCTTRFILDIAGDIIKYIDYAFIYFILVRKMMIMIIILEK